MITLSDKKEIENLTNLAIKNTGNAGAKLASSLHFNGGQIAFGLNRKKTHPFQARFGRNPNAIYLHAEIDAIIEALKKVSDMRNFKPETLYICRVTRNNEVVMSKPCLGCLRAIVHFDINRVVYTNELGEIKEL